MRPLPSDLHAAKSKPTKPPKKSATTNKSKRSKPSSRSADAATDLDNQPIASEPSRIRPKRPYTKPPQSDDESDDLAIKKKKVPGKAGKGKAKAIDPPSETFESAGTDVDLEGSRPGPSRAIPPPAKDLLLRDASPDVCEATTTPMISPVASDRGDVTKEELQQKPQRKKRGRPRNDEGGEEPPPKRGKIDGGGGHKEPAKKRSKRQPKSPSKPRSTATKGRTRKRLDPPPDMSDVERDGSVSPETRTSGSNIRKGQQRKFDGSDDEKQGALDRDEASSNQNRVRLDSIPPEGIVIRKKNGIVERLLPPVMYVLFRRLRVE
jgi:hypothetical protein